MPSDHSSMLPQSSRGDVLCIVPQSAIKYRNVSCLARIRKPRTHPNPTSTSQTASCVFERRRYACSLDKFPCFFLSHLTNPYLVRNLRAWHSLIPSQISLNVRKHRPSFQRSFRSFHIPVSTFRLEPHQAFRCYVYHCATRCGET